MTDTLPFPKTKPPAYLRLTDEPVFDEARHLQLETPARITALSELGYDASAVRASPSDFGVSSAFRILSGEGAEIMADLCRKMYSNRNESTGTGKNRLGSFIRGAGYRSEFIKDFCDSPALAAHISAITGTKLARHGVPAVACGINYAPEDLSKAVDTWHTDSVAFDIVMMISDPSVLDGGEFQYFHGTKSEGQAILGIAGEEGKDAELPKERINTIAFPAAGYGFLQQGNMIFHRACKLNRRAERITMVPSFNTVPAHARDATNSVNMAGWDDPGLAAELARYEAWRAAARLSELPGDIALTDSRGEITSAMDDALAPILALRDRLAQDIS